MAALQLFFRGAGGELTAVEVPADATVGDLLAAIHEQGLVPSPLRAVRFSGDLLADPAALLSDVGLASESTVEAHALSWDLKWVVCSKSHVEFAEDGKAVRNTAEPVGNMNIITDPPIPAEAGRFTIVLECLHKPSAHTACGLVSGGGDDLHARGAQVGHGGQTIQVSIGPDGKCGRGEPNPVSEGSRLEFAVSVRDRVARAAISLVDPASGEKQLLTYHLDDPEAPTLKLQDGHAGFAVGCYCFSKGQGWRILSCTSG
eukprot:TRINITY_DN21700_c0_g1_i1.p1 TRINITY_DN21700_c0_g1~~TRINITY_DN21700_c0_g1_i1.p1  ORF type:complete len:282 (+),score=36.93 TRINITY_DN21700_c0_g1_i1:72-848(+)